MMKGKILRLSFAAFFIGVTVSLGALDSPPLLNASFESVNNGAGATNDWGYVIDNWFENEQPYLEACFFEVGSTIDLFGDGSIWAGLEPGGTVYQTVGTVDDSATYQITALIGARWGDSFDTGTFSLYASTSDAATNAVDGVELSSFATLLSTINVTTNNGVYAGTDVFSVEVNLPTGTGHAGEVLWLEIGSASGKDYFDDIAITSSGTPTAPGPTWTTNLIVASEGVNGMAYSGSIANMAIDPDGDAITYAKAAGDTSWLTVSAGGTLGGIPDVLGTNTFTVTATDGTGTPAEATLTFNVRNTVPPEWTADPIVGVSAIIGESYTNSIAGQAVDPDGGTITYSLDSEFTWLNVESDGSIWGTPEAAHAGVNSFTVLANDGVDTPTSAILNIEVFGSVLGNSTAISVNFTESAGHANQQLASETEAGLAGYIYTQWNNTAGETGTKSSLIDSDGTTTAATVTWASNNMWGDDAATADADLGVGDAQIARGYLDDGNYEAAQEAAWTVTGIPFSKYNVVLYLGGDADGGAYLPFVANGITNSTTGTKHRYTNPNWDASNTIIFTGLSGDLNVYGFNRYELDDGTDRGSISGFQIINDAYVPGPAVVVAINGPVAGGMEISWIGENGKYYGVDTNSNLIVESGWDTWKTGILGDGGTITVTNAIGPDETFYRVNSELEP